MTVAATPYKESYAGNGVTTVFSVPFYFLADTDLVVSDVNNTTGVITPLVLNADYTVTGTGTPTGGAVTVTTATATGHTLTIERSLVEDQPTHFVDGDPLPASGLEQALDRIVMLYQQAKTALDRAAKFAVGSPSSSDLPEPQEGYVLGWVSGKIKNLSAATAQLAADLLSTAAVNKGAALIAYLAPYIGASARLLKDYLDDTITVAGKGQTTDISTELNAAITYAVAQSKNIVLFGDFYLTSQVKIDLTSAPAGTFHITGKGARIFIPPGTTPDFEPTVFDANGRSTQGVFLVYVPGDDAHFCVIEGCYFYKNNGADNPRTGTWINFNSTRNLLIRDNLFYGGGTQILATESYGLRIENNTFSNAQYTVWLRGAVNTCTIQKNIMRNNRLGILIDSRFVGDTTIGVKVQDNYFESFTGWAVYLNGVRGSLISGNYFEAIDQSQTVSTGYSCAVVFDIGVSPNAEPSSRNSVIANNINGTMYFWVLNGINNVFVNNNGLNLSPGALGSNSVIDGSVPYGKTTVTSFLNGWSSGNTIAATAPYYYKDVNGIIHLGGGMTGGTIGSTTPGFTLPVGYRPIANVATPVIGGDGTIGQCLIKTDGGVCIRVGTSAGGYSLEGVSFAPI